MHQVLHLGKKNKQYSYTMGGHAPGGQILEVTKCERDIGVLISNDLKPSLQCASAAQKANKLCTWIRLYKVYVRPLLEDCV